ncbi:hypothetical protein HHI36_006628 [Cryptolaemus montrouzieri]|uniref:Uncharacterized protein n=1 Tax=Cryptolaemus montrouzieri TaxID=559131 RepID=A0ABD2NY01_9CUCU
MAEAQRPEPSRVVPQDPPVAKLIDLDDSDDSPPTGAVGGAVPRLNPDDKRGKKPSRRPKSDGSEPDPDGGGEIIRESSADKKVEDCRAHLCMMDFREHDDYMEYTPRNIHRRSRSGRNYRRRHIPTPERRSKSEPKFMGSLIAACEKLIHGLWDTATGKYVTVVRDIPEDMAEMSFEGGVGKIEPTRQIKVKVLRKHLQGPTPKKSKTEFKLLKIPRFISKIGGTTRNRDEEERQNAHLDSQPGPSQRLRTEEEESTIDFEQPEPTTATETTPLTGKGKGKSPKGFGAVGKFAHSIGKFVKKSGSKTKSPDPKSSVSPQQHSVILERPSTSQETAQSIRIPLHSPTPHRPEQSTQVASSPPTGQTLEPSSRTALSPQPSQSVEQSIRPSLSPSTSQSVQRSTAQPASHPDYANIAPRSRQSHPDYVNIAPRSQQSHPDYVNITPGSSSQRKSKPEEETRPASGR